MKHDSIFKGKNKLYRGFKNCLHFCMSRLIHIFLALESVNVKKVFKIPGGKMYNITLFIYRIYNIYTKKTT